MQSKWEAHKSSAEKAESLGRLAQAEAYWYAALEEAQATFPMTDPRTTSTLECLSENLFRQSKYNLAVPVVAKALEIFEVSLGLGHADVGILLNNLGMLHHLQDNYLEAEKLYQRSMTVLSRALGPGHPEMANLLANYSDLLIRTNRAAEAHHMREMLKGVNTGRWTRVVVHESFRPLEEESEECAKELGLEYQHRASEVRLKMVQERIKNAALKQQQGSDKAAPSAKPPQKAAVTIAATTAFDAVAGVTAQADAAAPAAVKPENMPSSTGAPPHKGPEVAPVAAPQPQPAAAQPDLERTPHEQAQIAAAAARTALAHAMAMAAAQKEEEEVAALKRTQLPLDEQLNQQIELAKEKQFERKYISGPMPQTESPFDQLAAGLPQPVIPQFEHLCLTDPAEQMLPPGIAKILSARLEKKDQT